jgi:hypothetical protein
VGRTQNLYMFNLMVHIVTTRLYNIDDGLTRWCTTVFGKRTVAQLVKKMSAFCEVRVYKHPPLVFTRTHINLNVSRPVSLISIFTLK